MKPRTVPTILVGFAAVLASGLAAVAEPEFVPGKLREPKPAAEALPEFVPGKLREPAPIGPPIPAGSFMTVQEDLTQDTLRAGTPPGSGPGTAPAYMEKPCDGSRSAACSSCTKFKVCKSSDPAMDAMNPKKECPAATPYCSMSANVYRAVCQKSPDTADPACVAAKIPFPCTGVGFYPDPNSCQVYHYCSAAGAVAQDYDCPDGYKFTSKTNGCTLQANKCPTVTCPPMESTTSIYQAYPDDTMYYVHCMYEMVTIAPSTTPTTKITPYMFSCGMGATYNPATDQCVYKCAKEGNFVDTANPRHYYQCYLMTGKLVYKDQVCMANQKFDATAKTCV